MTTFNNTIGSLFVILLTTLITTPTFAVNDEGAELITEFRNICFAGITSYNGLDKKFKEGGWQEASADDQKKINKLLEIARSATKGKHMMKVFGKPIGTRRAMAVISDIEALPNVGCYIYGPGFPLKAAQNKIEKIMPTKPTRSMIRENNAVLLTWVDPKQLHPNLSLKFAYAYKGGMLDRVYGFPGLALATSIYKK